MNVPITVSTDLPGVQRIMVLVDRNPIRKVLELQPMAAQPAVSFRFKLEQASPVRALVQTADGLWHVGGTWVDSAGGGCTVSGATRADGSWTQTLGR
jgi:sulfur-oxidizing protein SoxY